MKRCRPYCRGHAADERPRAPCVHWRRGVPPPDVRPLVPGCVNDVVQHHILTRLSSRELCDLRLVSRGWAVACAQCTTSVQLRSRCGYSSIAHLSHLTHLDLRDNGRFQPHRLAAFPGLRALKLNALSALTFEGNAFRFATQIETLSVNNHALYDRSLSCISDDVLTQLRQLRALEFHGDHHLTDASAHLLTALRRLHVGHAYRAVHPIQLTGAFLHPLTQLTRLQLSGVTLGVLADCNLAPLIQLRYLQLHVFADALGQLTETCLHPLTRLRELQLGALDAALQPRLMTARTLASLLCLRDLTLVGDGPEALLEGALPLAAGGALAHITIRRRGRDRTAAISWTLRDRFAAYPRITVTDC